MGEGRGGGDVAAVSNRRDAAPVALAALGLAVPALLMLMAFAMTFRYRMEFYPALELLAFVGFACLLDRPPRRSAMALFAAGSLLSITVALMLWLAYMLSPFGMAATHLGQNSAVSFYRCLLQDCAAKGRR